MKRSQWFVLWIGFFLLSMFFIYLDSNYGNPIGSVCNEILVEQDSGYFYDTCLIEGKIYTPFIWLTFGLSLIFLWCGILEPGRKKK